ncbi:MAG: hypothetical protein JWM41_2529 [Gemmatimonadetes bacterium]|nr:hypothetical protein [Gemmatimonadota bacterium]
MPVRILEYQLVFAALLVAVGFRDARAQHIGGSVRDSASNQPIPGAVVSVLDATGRASSRGITDAAGRFRVPMPEGAVRLQVIRIGFRPITRTLAVAGAADTTVDFAMTALPTMLEAVSVVDQPRCSKRPDRATAFALWEQARAALLASVVARESSRGTMHVLLYDRLLDASGNRIQSQVVTDTAFVADRPLTSGRSTSEFAERGYVEDRAQGRRYYAPDADALLDSAFVSSHCFELREDAAAHANEIGLAFSPTPTNVAPTDIAGVLWLDRAHPALRTLEFTFTGLESEVLNAHAGGGLTFRAMPNGVIVTERWKLHVPLFDARPIVIARGGGIPLGQRVRATAMRDIGGELVGASWPDGTTWRATLATVGGRVIAAADGRPLDGAAVRLDGTNRSTRSDSTGHFLFEDVLPGPYTVEAADTVLAEFGLAQSKGAAVIAERGLASEVAVELPSRSAAIARLCRAQKRSSSFDAADSSRILLGQVVLTDARPAKNAGFRVAWRRPSGSVDSPPVALSGQTDSTGAFQVCGVPSGVPIVAMALRDSLRSPETTVTLAAGAAVGSITLELLGPGSPTIPAYRRRVLGVFDDASGEPIEGAEVLDASTDRLLGRTSVTGTVSLAALERGRSLVRIRKLGFPQRLIVVNVVPPDTLPITTTLSAAAQLATVTVTATDSRRAMLNGLNDRQRRGQGHFMASDDFTKGENQPLSELLGKLGMQRATYKGTTTFVGGHSGAPCPVTVYVDGVMYYRKPSDFAAHVPPVDFSSLRAGDYAAAEYYASAAEIPASLEMTGSGCGLLLLWTRD